MLVYCHRECQWYPLKTKRTADYRQTALIILCFMFPWHLVLLIGLLEARTISERCTATQNWRGWLSSGGMNCFFSLVTRATTANSFWLRNLALYMRLMIFSGAVACNWVTASALKGDRLLTLICVNFQAVWWIASSWLLVTRATTPSTTRIQCGFLSLALYMHVSLVVNVHDSLTFSWYWSYFPVCCNTIR